MLLEHSGDPVGVAAAFGLTYTPPDVKKAVQEAREHAQTVANTFRELGNILQKLETVIRKRWAKKSLKARIQLMEEAWPDIGKTHRPDLTYLRTHKPLRTIEQFLLPHINLEDLAKEDAFLHLLHSRGRHEPSMFVSFDLESVRFAQRNMVVRFEFDCHVADLSSDIASGRYGAVKDWDEPEDVDAVITGAISTTDCRWVLKIQDRTLRFLRDCCRRILHDKIADLDQGNIPDEPNEPAPLPTHDDKTESASQMALQRPYLVPKVHIDIQHTLNQAGAAFEEALEHVWLLREDPSYFATEVTNTRDHSFEVMRDRSRKCDENVDLPDKLFWHITACRMVVDAYRAVHEWMAILVYLQGTIDEHQLCVEMTQAGEDFVFKSHLKVGLTLRVLLDHVMLPATIFKVNKDVITSHGYRHHFVRIPGTLAVEPKALQNLQNLRQDPLGWLILKGAEHTSDRERAILMKELLISMDDILIEVQRILETDSEQKKTVSSFAARTIAQAGLQADLRSQLTSFWPEAFSPHQGQGMVLTSHPSNRQRAVENIKKGLLRTDIGLEEATRDPGFPNLGHLADPAGGRFAYPVHKKRTKETTTALRNAEAHLDAFWAQLDAAVEARDPEGHNELKELFGTRELARTPAWVEPLPSSSQKEQQQPPTANADNNNTAASLDNPLAQLSISTPQLEEGGKRTLLREASEAKQKVKTRGVADPSKAAAEIPQEPPHQDADEDDEPATTKPVFHLSKRDMRVVRVLFHHPSAQHNQLPGDVDWRGFLHTMVAVGFVARKMYGSAWNFSPSGEQLAALSRQSMIFHEPHPVGKLDFTVARRMGRRLTRAYGLDAECFEESK
jgi:hypothetical protein